MPLDPRLRRAFYLALVLLFASGASWLGASLVPDARWLATASMRVHGGAAMIFLVLAGGAVALHVPGAWRGGRNLGSGAALGMLLAALAATGYCLYYAGGEAARSVSSLSHWMLGIAALPAIAAHGSLGRRSRPPEGR